MCQSGPLSLTCVCVCVCVCLFAAAQASKMQSLHSWLVPVGQPRRANAADALLEWQLATAQRVGPWPPEGRKRGKPSRRQKWHELLQVSLRNGQDLPAWVGHERPEHWVEGTALEDVLLSEQAVAEVPVGEAEAEAVADGDALAKRRKRTIITDEEKEHGRTVLLA